MGQTFLSFTSPPACGISLKQLTLAKTGMNLTELGCALRHPRAASKGVRLLMENQAHVRGLMPQGGQRSILETQKLGG